MGSKNVSRETFSGFRFDMEAEKMGFAKLQMMV